MMQTMILVLEETSTRSKLTAGQHSNILDFMNRMVSMNMVTWIKWFFFHCHMENLLQTRFHILYRVYFYINIRLIPLIT